MKGSIALILIVGILACSPEPVLDPVVDKLNSLPLEVVYPSSAPYSEALKELGKDLFWDPILSGNRDVACVTCHHPQHGYAEQLERSIGVGGKGLSSARSQGVLVKRNSQTVLNSGFNGIRSDHSYDPGSAAMFWDNRVFSLELQALEPILSAEEMRGDAYAEEAALDSVVLRLSSIPEYQNKFAEAFGSTEITPEHLAKALATFQRSLVSVNSRFDQFARGDQTALTDLERRGMVAFSSAGCVDCHGGPMLSDFKLHVLSVPDAADLDESDDGDGTYAFRTPSLRNLSLTAPYMHNGIFATLEEVLEFYDDAQDESQNNHVADAQLDKHIRDLQFNDGQVNAILAFLNTLEDHSFDVEEPIEVPSGLPPGGNIR